MIAKPTTPSVAQVASTDPGRRTRLNDLQQQMQQVQQIQMMRQLYGGGGADSPRRSRRRGSDASIQVSNKKQRMEDTDEVLDQVAAQVSLESEWKQVLENWNPDKENLPSE